MITTPRGAAWICAAAAVLGVAAAGGAGDLPGGWSSRAPGSGGVRFSISFADDDTGWMSGLCVIAKTTNGGRTWRTQWSKGGAEAYWFNSVAAISRDVAMASGFAYGRPGAGVVVRTDDGGATWRPVRIGGAQDAQYNSISFAPGGRAGYVISNREGLFASRDGGLTWSHAPLPSDPRNIWVATSTVISVPDDRHVFVGGGGGVAASSDGGLSWGFRPVPGTGGRQFQWTHFATPTRGWVSAGETFETSDGGATWMKSRAPGRPCFRDPKAGWAVNRYDMFQSTDGGETWGEAVRIGGGHGFLNAMAFTSRRAYVVGGSEGVGFAFAADRLLPGVEDDSPPDGVVPITFTMPEAGRATIQVTDEKGAVVENVVAGKEFPAGRNTVWWDLGTLDDFWPPFTRSHPAQYDTPPDARRIATPGTYRWRGLWHPGLSLEYAGSFYPVKKHGLAWITPDHTGGWLGDHAPPKTVVRAGDTMYVGTFCEGGEALLQADLDMKKLWGSNRMHLACPHVLAADGDHVYFIEQGGWLGFAGQQITMIRVSQATRQAGRVFAISSEEKLEDLQSVDGLAVVGDRAYVADRKQGALVVVDLAPNLAGRDERMHVVKKLPLESPGRVRPYDDRRLACVSGTRVVLVDRETFEVAPAVAGLANPYGLGVDGEGRFYVGEMEPVHQVKVYSRAGRLERTIGRPGRHRVGPFDPDNLESPTGVEVDARGNVWVCEQNPELKRTSVWDRRGRCVNQVLGPTEYGGAGDIDPDDENRFFFRGKELRRDPGTGEVRLVNIIWRFDDERYDRFVEPRGHNFHGPSPAYPFRKGEKLFFSMWGGYAMGELTTLWVYDKDHVRPVAACGKVPGWLREHLGKGAADPRFGRKVASRVDPRVDFSWPGSPAAGVAADNFAVRWTGTIEVPRDGTYRFFTTSDDGVRLFVDGKKVVENWTPHGPTLDSGAVELAAGAREIVLEFFEAGGGAAIRLEWEGPGVAREVVPEGALRAGDARGLWGEFFHPGHEESIFAWTDANDDGRVDAGEVRLGSLPGGGAIWGVRMNRDFEVAFSTVAGDVGIAFFRVERATPQGYPVWELPTEYRMVPDFVIGDPNQVQSVMVDGGGNAVAISPYVFSMSPDGKVNWRYRCRWPGLHAGLGTTATGAEPGVMIAPIRFYGSGVVSDALGEVICIGTNYGATDLITADGLYVGRAFQDSRRGDAWAFNAPPTLAELERVSLGQEHFGGTFQRVADGRERASFRYVVAGGGPGCSVVELKGLERVRRFEGGRIRVTPGHLAEAERLRQRRAREVAEPKRAVVARLARVEVDGRADEWPKARISDGAGGRFSLGWDRGNLYVLFEGADDRAVFRNAATANNFVEAFKTGDVVDIMLETREGLDPNRDSAGRGDVRLSFALVDGEPAAMLYDFVVPGTPPDARKSFASPWRTLYVDRVEIVPGARIAVARRGDGFTLEAAVPLAALHLEARSGREIRGDVGRVLSDQTGTRVADRVYWSNRNTRAIADLPSEVQVQPGLWGVLAFE